MNPDELGNEGSIPEKGEESLFVGKTLESALETLKRYKPNDKSEIDRRYAVTITEMEKTCAYFAQFVVLMK